MDHDEIVSGLILELRRGTLILLVLNQLQRPMYGYNLVKELQYHGGRQMRAAKSKRELENFFGKC